MSTISTHVLDSATGRPAAAMTVCLETLVVIDETDRVQGWMPLSSAVTDPDGRIGGWGDAPVGQGTFRLVFATGDWFAGLGRECFYPEVIITFTVNDDSHFHVPLLLAAYAYSTYRGS
jgi:5-hydroxyisourate hydrolase